MYCKYAVEFMFSKTGNKGKLSNFKSSSRSSPVVVNITDAKRHHLYWL